jgi:hypothetical protein
MLDIKTQLPVSYSDDEVDETYEFFPASSTPFVIPDKFKAELKNQLEYLKAQAARP